MSDLKRTDEFLKNILFALVGPVCALAITSTRLEGLVDILTKILVPAAATLLIFHIVGQLLSEKPVLKNFLRTSLLDVFVIQFGLGCSYIFLNYQKEQGIFDRRFAEMTALTDERTAVIYISCQMLFIACVVAILTIAVMHRANIAKIEWFRYLMYRIAMSILGAICIYYRFAVF